MIKTVILLFCAIVCIAAVPPPNKGANVEWRVPKEMVKTGRFQYKTTSCTIEEHQLNVLGQDRWELVGIHGGTMFFKREIIEEK